MLLHKSSDVVLAVPSISVGRDTTRRWGHGIGIETSITGRVALTGPTSPR
ncbi:MAG TPA: hypothetical protein VG674_30725 [Amycolatopsis sp.]|nr:hypothetical protein [Amycolatopsis sp.]